MRQLAYRLRASIAVLALAALSGGCSSDKGSKTTEADGGKGSGEAGADTGVGGATGEAGADTGRGGVTGEAGSDTGKGGVTGRGGSNPGVGGATGRGGSNPGVGGATGRGGSSPGVGGATGRGGANTGVGGATGEAGADTGLGGSGGLSIPDGLLDPDATTTWNPGILVDTETNEPLGGDGVPVRTTLCQTVTPDEAASLQDILDGCATGTVVELQAGTYSVPATVYVPSGVVLRGQGSAGDGATVVVLDESASDGPTLAIGPVDLFDQTCYQNSNYTDAVVDLVADAQKEQSTISIAPGDTTFQAGDFALLDEAIDESIISVGDSDGAFSRNRRVLSQRVEIAEVDTATGTLTLTSPLHWTFRTSQQAQIANSNYPVTKWAGIEHLWVQGGRGLGDYLGRRAGGVDVSNAAYCWVKDVQTDGTLTGMHVTLTGTNRCVVRDSHFHNSAQYGFGQDNYGIVVRCGASDNLVENNIARYMNKPILLNNSGGGNVIGYNYADNEWSLDSNSGGQFQEASIDIHCAFPHMELIEGNFAPHIAASTTHGNGGYLTYFRNYASSQQAPDPIVWSLPSLPQTGNVTAMQFDNTDHHMTVIGNVLGSTTDASLGVPTSLETADVSQVYMAYEDGTPSIFSLGAETDVSVTTLMWHGNFDTVNGDVMWNPDISTRTLPASLYYTSKPGWWPAGASWPWVGPDVTPMVGTLPAQVSSSAFDYNTSNNPSCTPNLGNYSCP